jgi:hypothetical protein
MNINDIRVGMKLVFGEEKLRMTKGKVYEVIRIERQYAGPDGLVYVHDDRGNQRNFYARRFERIAEDVPAVPPAPHKFQVGDVVAGNDGRQWDIINVLENGKVFVRGPLPGGLEFKNARNEGYDPDKFNLVRKAIPEAAPIPFADMAAERAPEAPQQAAVGVAVPAYVPKVGDRVRLLDGANLPFNEWWIEADMREMVGKEFVISHAEANNTRFRLQNDNNEYAYLLAWLEPAVAVPARPFAVGDIVNQKGNRMTTYKVLELIGENRIRISRADDHDVALGHWPEDMFELVRRANGGLAEAIIKAVQAKLEVGNHVKVVKKTDGKPIWVDQMNDTIGKVYKIERYDDWAKAYQLTNGFMYKAEALELAKEEDIKMAKKAVKKFPDLRSLIAQSRKEDIKNVKGVSSYVVFVKNMDTGEITLNKHLRDVCHARLSVYYPDRKVNKEAVAVIDYQQEHYKQVEERAGKEFIPSYKKFVDYIVNRSPWAVAFQGKTVKNVLENGVLMNVEAPSGAVAGACQALRYLSEFAYQNAIWKLLMDNGIQEDAAFLTTYALIKEENGTFTKNQMGGGHQPINGAIAAGSLISFFANGYNEAFLKSEPYRTRTSYVVHKHVEDVKDVLRIPMDYNRYVSANVEWTKQKEGWAEVMFATEEQVLAFARHLEQQINKAREAK